MVVDKPHSVNRALQTERIKTKPSRATSLAARFPPIIGKSTGVQIVAYVDYNKKFHLNFGQSFYPDIVPSVEDSQRVFF